MSRSSGEGSEPHVPEAALALAAVLPPCPPEQDGSQPFLCSASSTVLVVRGVLLPGTTDSQVGAWYKRSLSFVEEQAGGSPELQQRLYAMGEDLFASMEITATPCLRLGEVIGEEWEAVAFTECNT